MADAWVRRATALFAVSTALSSALAVREQIRGEPFGLQVPGGVKTHLALGLGAGIAAPWPMPVAANWAAWRDAPDHGDRPRTVAVVGAMLLAGVLMEPVSWGRRPASRLAKATVPLHLALGAAMLWRGRAFEDRTQNPSVHDC